MQGQDVLLPLDAMPERLQPIIAPEAAPDRKMLVARAAVPLPPDQLLPALAFLTNDQDTNVRKKAVDTLREMPDSQLGTVLNDRATHPGVLDRLAKVFWEFNNVLEKIVLNRSTPSETFVHLAKHGSGSVLDIIAANQKRIADCPDIVQAIYFNPKAKMSTVSRVLEFAVREELPIKHMPGYKEIVASVMGDAQLSRPMAGGEAEAEAAAGAEAAEQEQEAAQPEVEPAAPQPAAKKAAPFPKDDWQDEDAGEEAEESEWDGAWDEDEEEGEEEDFGFTDDMLGGAEQDLFDDLLAEADQYEGEGDGDGWGEFEEEGTDPGLEDDSDEAFFAVLAAALEGDGDDSEPDRESAFITDRIKDMTVSERVRLALMGNGSARGVLIKDTNHLVSAAVLRNPGLNEREVLSFSMNRNISKDIINSIAGSREFTRNHMVKVNLCNNPKTPLHRSMQFLRHMRAKDLKGLAKNRDVPSALARAAKRIMSEKRMG